MIIKITPEEGDFNVTEVEHHNVKEFFIFGNKKDEDEDFVDFHDWRGSYRYLMGSMAYFNEVIKDEKASSLNSPEHLPQIDIATELDLRQPTADIENVDGDNVIQLDTVVEKEELTTED